MLSKEEFTAFLTLLLSFAHTCGLSAASCAKVLGVSHQTMARWIAEARRLEAGHAGQGYTAYAYMADPVAEKIHHLNKVDAAHGLYATLVRAPSATKTDKLLAALEARAL